MTLPALYGPLDLVKTGLEILLIMLALVFLYNALADVLEYVFPTSPNKGKNKPYENDNMKTIRGILP